MNQPLLGVAGAWGPVEVELYRRFDDLHQLIYTRGGIRPANAAVEEVAKLMLVRQWQLRHSGQSTVDGTVAGVRAAFAAALADPELRATDPAGRSHPIWPADEPFRLADPSVLAAAVELVAAILPGDRPAVSDPLGTAFDALLAGRYEHAGGLGTYLTPSGVARAMAEIAIDLIDPAVAGAPMTVGFGDPYCGTGRFLVAALEVLRERADRAPDDPLARALLAAGPFGADQSTAAVAKARINMLLYGVPHPLVWTVRDSVTDSDVDGLAGTVALVLTNPPFGEGKYDDPDGLLATTAALPRLAGRRRTDPSLAGLVRAAGLLAPGGVLGIVLPDGVITSAAVADLLVDAPADPPRPGALAGPELAGQLEVAAQISLPVTTFALSGTVAKTGVLFLRRRNASARPDRRVALARVDHVGYLRQAGRAVADPAGDQLAAVSAAIRTGLRPAAGDPGHHPPGRTAGSVVSAPAGGAAAPVVAVVPAGSVPSLDLDRLDPEALQARQRLVRAGGVELSTVLSAAPVRRSRTVASPFISVLHVDDLGTVDWHAARTHHPTTPGINADEGELIVSLLNPARLRAAVIPDGAGRVQVSAEFGVFRAAGDPYAVLALLYAAPVRAQLRPLGRGTSSSRRRIGVADVLSLVVPSLPAEAMSLLGKEVRAAERLIADGRQRLWTQFAAVDPESTVD